ncbi:MAG TPA: tetraacyldisaccharide 4'-kinase [Opitutales bacterium]|nr:tetraacyldisaccharide 4'-kinase [Opitutales bacterium]
MAGPSAPDEGSEDMYDSDDEGGWSTRWALFRAGVRRMKTEFVHFAVDVVYDRNDGRAAFWFGAFLKGFSYIFTGVVKLRLFLYRHRILQDAHLGCMVIVVGNLTMGGTGKTPVVERLARALQARGRKVAILSRGYKSKKEPLFHKGWRWLVHQEPTPPKVVSDGVNVLLDSFEAGDEPFMLAKNLPGVCVVVDKDRVKAGQYAVKKFGVDTLILDDGFQYFRLKDHMQLLLVDKTNPFGNGSLIPRGILREPVEHLKRASYVFLTKSDGVPDPALEDRIRAIRPGTEIIECTHAPRFLREVFGPAQEPLAYLQGKKVACLSAIAAPESFEGFVRKHGATIVSRSRFLDHHRFDQEELAEVFEDATAAGAEILVTTEKDAVRFDPGVKSPLPMYYLRVEIEIISGAADFEEAVDRISRIGRG